MDLSKKNHVVYFSMEHPAGSLYVPKTKQEANPDQHRQCSNTIFVSCKLLTIDTAVIVI